MISLQQVVDATLILLAVGEELDEIRIAGQTNSPHDTHAAGVVSINNVVDGFLELIGDYQFFFLRHSTSGFQAVKANYNPSTKGITYETLMRGREFKELNEGLAYLERRVASRRKKPIMTIEGGKLVHTPITTKYVIEHEPRPGCIRVSDRDARGRRKVYSTPEAAAAASQPAAS